MEIVCSTEIASPYLRTFLWISILFIYLHKLPHCTYLNELIMKFALYLLGAEDLSYMLNLPLPFYLQKIHSQAKLAFCHKLLSQPFHGALSFGAKSNFID